MFTQRSFVSAAVLMAVSAVACFGQAVTAAHSGLLHYFEGSVSIDGTPVQAKASKFFEIKENSVLSTGQGRAEVLLTPGVFLRVAENSEIKMLDNRLLSTRVEILSGSAMVESDDPQVSLKDPAVTIVYKDYQIQPMKFGVFEVTSDPSAMKVYKGEANVIAGGIHKVVKEGNEVPFSAALVSEKFNPKQADDLYLWTRDRSSYISSANMSSARTLSANGYSMDNLYLGATYPGLGFYNRFAGGWYMNPYLNMYTYMPYDGMMFSPFGYGFFSPGMIYSYYSPYNYYWYGGGGARNGGTVGVPVQSASLNPGQITHLAGTSIHPTLTSPLGSFNGGGVSAAPSSLMRGGIGNNPGGSPISAARSAGPSLGGGGGFSAAPAASGGGAGGGARSAGGGAGARGR